MEATAAQHIGRNGKPAQFTRNGILETCQCRECRTLSARPSSPKGGAETDPLADLVARFSAALLEKLRAAQAKGRSGWDDPTWERECVEGLHRHANKGDPRDVAAYAAFCWHHGWATTPSPLPSSGEVWRKALEDCLGCVTAAEAEGLHEIIAELRGRDELTDSLIDRVERRLLWVRNYAEPVLASPAETAGEPRADRGPGNYQTDGGE